MQPVSALLFPQWQGSGSPQARRLEAGAEQLATLLGDSPTNVELSDSADPRVQAGILGRAALLQQLERARGRLTQLEPSRLVTLGGDCGVDLAPASYLNARYDNLGLIWLDAHSDLNTPDSSPSGAFHGMVLRTLLGEGDPDFLTAAFSLFEPEQVFLAGARDFDPPERAFAERLEHVSSYVLECQPERLVERLEARGFDTLHIHLDLDVLEPAEFGATGYPTLGGLSMRGLERLLGVLQARFEVVGLTLTEFMPREKGDLDKVRRILRAAPLVRVRDEASWRGT